PVAVWAWNAALALVCGDPVIWKPSEKTPLCAQAVMTLVRRALDRFGDAPDELVQLVQGGRDVGEALVDDPRVALVSATGSTAMGRVVGPRVAQRFGRVLGDRIERVEAVAGGFYVRPAIVELDEHSGSVLQETFAPILYVLRYRDLEEAIAMNNAVTQGLSSSIFTNDLREGERFMSAAG